MSTRASLVIVAIVVAAGVVLAAMLAAGVGPFASSASGGGPRYDVTFTEIGLPPGTTWSVTLAGTVQTSSGQISFSEPDGAYSYSVGKVQTFNPSPASGQLFVNGTPRSVIVFFINESRTPLGTAFAWGSPVNATGVTTAGCASPTGHYCYSIEIVGSSVNTSDVQLELGNAAGASVPWPLGVNVSLINPSVESAVANYSTTSNTWNLVAPFTGQIVGGFTVVIYTSSTGLEQGLLGDRIVALGTDGYSGSVPSEPFS